MGDDTFSADYNNDTLSSARMPSMFGEAKIIKKKKDSPEAREARIQLYSRRVAEAEIKGIAIDVCTGIPYNDAVASTDD